MNLLEILNMINAQQVCHSVCHKARHLSLCFSISVLPLLLYKIEFFTPLETSCGLYKHDSWLKLYQTCHAATILFYFMNFLAFVSSFF